MIQQLKALCEHFLGNEDGKRVTFRGKNATAASSSTGVALAGATAPGAGKCFYITSVHIANVHATAEVGAVIQDEDDAMIATFNAPAMDQPAPPVHHFNPPLKSTTNKALEVACLTSAGTVWATVTGYIGPA